MSTRFILRSVLPVAGEQIVDMVAGSGKVQNIADFHAVVAARDNSLMVALDSRDVKVSVLNRRNP